MPWQKLADALFYLNIAGAAALFLRLLVSGLVGRYRWFSAFLLYALARALVIGVARFTPKQYFPFYVVTESLLWIFYLMIVLELFDRVLEQFPGIRSLSSWTVLTALAISIGAATASAWRAIHGGPTAEKYSESLLLFFAVERGVLFGLALLILLMSGFLLWFPIPLARNVVFHSFLFSVYFLSKALALLLRTATGSQGTAQVRVAVMAVGVASLVGWTALLRRSGESTPLVLRHRRNREEEERLVSQLKEVNRTLAGKHRD